LSNVVGELAVAEERNNGANVTELGQCWSLVECCDAVGWVTGWNIRFIKKLCHKNPEVYIRYKRMKTNFWGPS